MYSYIFSLIPIRNLLLEYYTKPYYYTLNKLYRSKPYLLAPAALYELAGDVPNVVFPCAALEDGEKVAVYYGAADTSVCMAFGYIDEILHFVKNNSL